MEVVIGVLILAVILSWMITLISKSATMQNVGQQEDLAQAHAEFVLSQLQKAPFNTLAGEIQKGTWNYPNAPSITAAGLMALPKESIMTECTGTSTLQVTVTVRWQSHDGLLKEKTARLMMAG